MSEWDKWSCATSGGNARRHPPVVVLNMMAVDVKAVEIYNGATMSERVRACRRATGGTVDERF